jgi:hypothetical protein
MFCPHCGKEVNEGQAFCHSCGGRIAAPETPAVAGREKTPWEDRDRRGVFGGLFDTLRGALFSPSEFFRKMNVTGGIADPLLYAMIVGVVSIMVLYVWQILFQNTFQGYLPSDVKGAGGLDFFSGIGLAFVALFMPFFVILGLFLWSGILHVLLMMVRGANNGFEATFRAIAYGYSAYVFMMLPFCGGLIGTIWTLVLAIIGLKEAHGTSGGKASFAVLFPMILCCAVAFLVVVLVLGTVAASFGTMKTMPWK